MPAMASAWPMQGLLTSSLASQLLQDLRSAPELRRITPPYLMAGVFNTPGFMMAVRGAPSVRRYPKHPAVRTPHKSRQPVDFSLVYCQN